MGNLTVSVLGAQDYGATLGKKGTSTDITLYNLKKEEDTITFIEPTRYPERLAPLFYATSLAKKAIVVVDELNSALGECLVMLNCAGVESGFFVLRNYLTKEKVQPLIKGTNLEKFEFLEDNPTLIKEKLLNEVTSKNTSIAPECPNTKGTVPVDHSFNVKGVGAVILGLVANGKIAKHETLDVLPGTKKAMVRSVQKHDDEFDLACEGDRVGLALRNVEVEDLERGTVLTSDTAMKCTRQVEARAELVKYWQAPMKKEMVVHLGHWMQFLPARVESITEDNDWHTPLLKLNLEKEIVHRTGDRAVLAHLEGGKLRVAGTLTLP